MQTTSIDDAAGLIRLTTTLAHSSGRMGVVGLAGLPGQRNGRAASDGSRPHLCPTLCAVHPGWDCRRGRSRCTGSGSCPRKQRPIRRTDRLGKPQTGTLMPPGHRIIPAAEPQLPDSMPPILAADLSAQLRDRLLGELSGLQSSDEAANWAHRSLPAKDTLIIADAQLVEDGFRVKMAALGEVDPEFPEAKKSRIRQPKYPGISLR